MKRIDIRTQITDEAEAIWSSDPIIRRVLELGEKVRAGTATEEEIAEYEQLTAEARALPTDEFE
ncbi:hypothetical protein [Luteolibacter luteus]|uniref:Uncharacterized protein n=1 Tax=Luteolibacter luteus TaxID=2728835 RepID=A0A858RHD7_9BACT|nr:hypothetical protein [Luteolibacter luteus]QJE95964.1 hypothetical protein HHL09_09275 [Luteolibacter luteus]